MKRAKVMLTAITVLALVGGALAFKAKSFQTLYITDGTHARDCNVQTTIYTQTTLAPSIALKASTASGTSNCVTLNVTTSEN